METKVMRDNVRDYRRAIEIRAEENDNGDMVVSGTAVIFGQKYKLFDGWDGKPVMEIIEKEAFNSAEMKDVPMKYNHGDERGVLARTTAKTDEGKLILDVNENGVDIRANLVKTTAGKDMFEEIRTGLVPQMSWAFTIEDGGQTREETEDEIVYHIRKVKRVYDVSAVDFGANPNTSIYARRQADEADYRDAHLDEMKRSEAKTALKKQIEEILKK